MPHFGSYGLENLSDADLLSMAQNMGIETTPFMVAPNPILQQLGQVSSFGGQLPTASLAGSNIPMDIGPEPQFGENLGLSVDRPEFTLPEDVRNQVALACQGQRELGSQDLRRAAIEAAESRGLNFSDTPIADPYLRSRALMESQLRGQEAQALLGLSERGRDFLQQQRIAREQALQNRFGLTTQNQAQRYQAILGRLGLAEQGRQFGGQFGLNLAGMQENALQNRFSLFDRSLLGRGQFFEGQRQFEAEQQRLREASRNQFLQSISNFQEGLRQQAFQNRLALAGGIGETGLGLARSRLGVQTGQTTTAPTNIGGGLSALSLGLGGRSFRATPAANPYGFTFEPFNYGLLAPFS